MVLLAYLSLASVLLTAAVARSRAGTRLTGIVLADLAFAFFIFFCGIGHGLDAYSVVWVSYPLHTAVVWLTAAASWWAVFRLPLTLFPASSDFVLNEKPEQLKVLLDSSSDAVYMVDSAGHVVWCNKRLQELTGLSDGDIEGRFAHELLHHSRVGESGQCEHYPWHQSPIYLAQHQAQEVVRDNEAVFSSLSCDPIVTARLLAHPVRNTRSRVLGVMVVLTRLSKTNMGHSDDE